MFAEIMTLNFEVDYKQQQLLQDDQHRYQDHLKIFNRNEISEIEKEDY
jgi:hypothetical protein